MAGLNLTGIGVTSRRIRERLVQRLRDDGIRNQTVLDVILDTPRHIFVDEAFEYRAYEDSSLPIGHAQTISQPYVVAKMTESLLAGGKMPQKILEIGTGSGYQTAILSQIFPEIYSVERIKPLLMRAQKRLTMLGVKNVKLKHGDGYLGWMEQGLYDGIIVTAAPTEIPKALLDQLAVNGKLIIPVGMTDKQELQCVTRKESGEFSMQCLDYVRFVPLVSGTGK